MEKSTRAWNTRLEYSENYLANVYINKGIFQGDSLSLLLFITSLICLSGILRNAVQDDISCAWEIYTLLVLLFKNLLNLCQAFINKKMGKKGVLKKVNASKTTYSNSKSKKSNDGEVLDQGFSALPTYIWGFKIEVYNLFYWFNHEVDSFGSCCRHQRFRSDCQSWGKPWIKEMQVK